MIKISIPSDILDICLNKHYDYFMEKGPTSKKVRNLHPPLPPLTKTYYQILEYEIINSIGDEKDFFEMIRDNLKNILIGCPIKLQKIIDDIESQISAVLLDRVRDKRTSIYKRLNRIFNYESFTRRRSNNWGAYKMAEYLQVNVCPYCNRQFTSTYFHKTGNTRPTFDHFWNKKTYPYLEISFYNLVPSCNVCNSSFKSDKSFSLNTHLNPYLEAWDHNLKFVIDLKKDPNNLILTNTDTLLAQNDDFNINVEFNPGCNKALKARIAENNSIFKISELYNFHKDYIRELSQKKLVYPKNYIEDLWHDFGTESSRKITIFNSKDEIRKMIVGNYILQEEWGRRPLSKFMSDIAKGFNLI